MHTSSRPEQARSKMESTIATRPNECGRRRLCPVARPGPAIVMFLVFVFAKSSLGFTFPASQSIRGISNEDVLRARTPLGLSRSWHVPTNPRVLPLRAMSSNRPSFGGSSDYGSNSTDGAMSTGPRNATTLLIVTTPTPAKEAAKDRTRSRPQDTKKQREVKKQADRFDREASKEIRAAEPVIITIHGLRYNLTEWAHAHPGGAKILEKYARTGEDAGEAFERASHSHMAVEMLNDFLIEEEISTNSTVMSTTAAQTTTSIPGSSTVVGRPQPRLSSLTKDRRPLWRVKLFTVEDPQNLHKTMGVYSLVHFLYRIVRMLFFDPAAGLTGRAPVGKFGFLVALASLVPHFLLSVSSLIFHTVPKERVVGRPMIWQEFRAHNIVFGVRSVVCAALCLVATRYAETDPWVRTATVVGSGAACFGAMVAADVATEKLRINDKESTTATMPYWEGCSTETQRRFKNYYAFSQFMATLACLAVMNPAWPFVVLLPIQLASLLMTLVRKGLLSARGYHYAYAGSLAVPYVVGIAHTFYMKTFDFLGLFGVGSLVYALRKQGVDKYALWVPVIVGRVLLGDYLLNWKIW
mmetsp:Transcript_55665/g.131146  ORF Transcript_55665/g.131146 Transcript_55665/m.131146 type:complete len:581 (-) Transcript_55665:581-2323(-)